MAADDLHQLTPVLVEAALSFDERAVPLYNDWCEDVLPPLIDRLDDVDDSTGKDLTPKEWEALHAEIGFSILIGLTDTENLRGDGAVAVAGSIRQWPGDAQCSKFSPGRTGTGHRAV